MPKEKPGKLLEGDCCASSHPVIYGRSGRLPAIDVMINGKAAIALVDSGCTSTMVRSNMVDGWSGECSVKAFDGYKVKGLGFSNPTITIDGNSFKTNVMVVEKIVEGFDIVMGMDLILKLGGMRIAITGEVEFGKHICATNVCEVSSTLDEIDDKDFVARFVEDHWIVSWKWKEGVSPPVLKNNIGCYNHNLVGEKKASFEAEVERWISEGILVPWQGEVGGFLPLMAVEQPTKKKVRPVLDYRELNEFVECHTGDDVTDICSERLRDWRKIENPEIVDLKSAYLQVRISPDLWKYQLVKYKDKVYCLTRLGFGLASGPRIMSKIVKSVLALSPSIREGTSSYIDDIIVDQAVVSSREVGDHLRGYGLISKEPELVAEGAALGLRVEPDKDGTLVFKRGNEIPDVVDGMTRKELFSLCGKLVGHYPLAGWLRVTCSYMKRKAEGSRWNDYVGDKVFTIMKEIVKEVRANDPVTGCWTVPRSECGTVWCDASSLAIAVLVEVEGIVVEDAAWLRKKDDFNHINVAELEAALKGVNLAIKWGLKEITLVTDSATVYRWIEVTMSEEKKIKTKGAAEIVIKRRLGVLKSLVAEFELKLKIRLVPSCENKSDDLTRVRKKWMVENVECEEMCAAGSTVVNVKECHETHHMGEERTLFLARRLDPGVTKEEVKAVVRSCERCQRIDPAPVVHKSGELCVGDNWERLAMDVTHYRNRRYLTLIDCGPSRFAIWRLIHNETAEVIVKNLEEIFFEHGPPSEILMDNATAFRSERMSLFLNRWNVRPCFRAAYRPSGNGIIERHHRTVKALAERGSNDPVQAVYWYNISPRNGQDSKSVPQSGVFRYQWRQPQELRACEEEENTPSNIKIGDEVWVKPPDVKCTSTWSRGKVTAINSANNVEVDGMPRHVLDLRPVFIEGNDQQIDHSDEDGDGDVEIDNFDEDRDGDVEITTDDSGSSGEYAECMELVNEVPNKPAERQPRALERLQSFNNPGSRERSPLRERRNRCPPRQ